MAIFSTPAVILRRVDYGDYDLILSFMTRNEGKISAIAKSAKKSTKRFAGILEPFSIMEIVYSTGKGRAGLPVLQEAVLKQPFPMIRSNFSKTAYASYWAELINEWMEEGIQSLDVFGLLCYILKELDAGATSASALSILFQMQFITQIGYGPNLTHCSICKKGLEDIKTNHIALDIKKGGIICNSCPAPTSGRILMSKGTVKQLLWMGSGDLSKARKIKLHASAIDESLEFLELFVPYHLGKSPRSLSVLQNLRNETGETGG